MRSATILACLALAACTSQPAFGPGSTAAYPNTTILVANAGPPFQLYESFRVLCPVTATYEGALPCGYHLLGQVRTSRV
jgi:hypothetical protein